MLETLGQAMKFLLQFIKALFQLLQPQIPAFSTILQLYKQTLISSIYTLYQCFTMHKYFFFNFLMIILVFPIVFHLLLYHKLVLSIAKFDLFFDVRFLINGQLSWQQHQLELNPLVMLDCYVPCDESVNMKDIVAVDNIQRYRIVLRIVTSGMHKVFSFYDFDYLFDKHLFKVLFTFIYKLYNIEIGQLLQTYLMDSKKILQDCVIQSQKLYQNALELPQPDLQHKKRLIQLKVQGEYDGLIKRMQEQNKTTSTPIEEPTKQKNKPQQSQIQLMISELITPSQQQRRKIKTFQKYQTNVDEVKHEKHERTQAIVSSGKLQMGLSDATKLGTIRAGSLRKLIKPTWHAPWKLYRVIIGHQGWVRSVAISPCNTYFATGSADRTIKFWDLASGELKISLTGHINTVRALEFSKYHPYLFSCGQDKSVKCWDLQMNKVIRNYHGHLSGVYSLKVHNGLGILVTGGRDCTARIWDIRVRRQIHSLVGHSHTVGSIITQEDQPHIITGSFDSYVKLWDVGQGKCMKTLTNHKKSIRTMVEHPKEYTFATASSDNIKVWKCPNAQFLRNISGHNSIINAMALNQDDVLVTGGDDGTVKFWDWPSGYNFQNFQVQPQPGSISAENAIYSLAFDRSGTRLLSCECDKTIKLYRQDENATEETHPIKSFKMQFK